MKKIFYLTAFTLLGFLLQLLTHALIEIWYINLLLQDFSHYSLGWTWDTWYTIHIIGTWILIIFGLMLGYLQGKYWWRKIYANNNQKN